MMTKYRIVTDATCDIRQDILDTYQIDVIPMQVAMDDGRTFWHYPDFRNFSAHDFYAELRKGNLSHSTQITPQQYLDFFRPLLSRGEDILYVCFTSGLSSTYGSALFAQKRLMEEFPDRTLTVVDSLCASGGEGVLAVQAGRNRDEKGMSLAENAAWLQANTVYLAHYFTVGTLTYLHKGGRVSAATAIFGNALNIKPVLHVDDNGKLVMLTTVHGFKASINKLVSLTKQTVEHPEEQTLYIAYTDCEDEAIKLKEQVISTFPCRNVEISTIGPVVGTHLGPEGLCLFSWGSGRKPQ